MELELKRTYLMNGTNGDLFFNKKRICSTIELPWKENKPRVSCIPEGRYCVIRRYSKKLATHLYLQNVPGRSLILIHPANDAVKELKGCIAPVSTIIGAGKGLASKAALKKIFQVIDAEKSGQSVSISISKLVPSGILLSNTFKTSIVKTVVKRMQKKTPIFFKKLRNIGLATAAIAATILAGPVALPAIIVKVAGYLAVAGGVLTTVSQTAVKRDN